MDPNLLTTTILKTGFELEYRVSEVLRNAGWSVISNKYYIDDLQENVREIDLLAYKVSEVREFQVYTVLIVSCKKNERDAWVLLSKKLDRSDHNVDWQPFHVWSNIPSVEFSLEKKSWTESFASLGRKAGCANLVSPPAHHIFAFQQMDLADGAPHNDKDIFNSVVSLMKAQAYELGALPDRKKTPAVYQFNLLSVVDTDLVRLDFKPTQIVAFQVSEEHYIAWYIIAKRQTFARIHFITAQSFKDSLSQYGQLHELNVSFYDKTDFEFYADAVFNVHKRLKLLGDFQTFVYTSMIIAVPEASEISREKINLSANRERSSVSVDVDVSDEAIEALRASNYVEKRIAKALKEIYRYEGPYTINKNDLPF